MRLKKRNGEAWMRAQTTVCVLLILVMFAASFIPLYSVDVEIPSKMQSAVDQIEEVLNDPAVSGGENIEVEFPEKLNVNLMLFFKAGVRINDVVRLYRGMSNLAEVQNAKDTNAYYQAYNRLRTLASDAKGLIENDDFSSIIALGATVVSGYSQSTLSGIIMILMVVMTVVLPVTLFLALMTAVIGLLAYSDNTEKRYLWIMRAFRSATSVYLLALAVLLFDSNVHFSLGIVIGLVACVGGFALSAFACRRKEYSAVGRRYLNLVQIVSAIETAMFFALYFSVARSDIIGQYAALIGKRAIPYVRSKAYGEEFLDQFLFMLLAFAGVVALIVTLWLLPSILSKLGGMQPHNKDSNIFAAFCSVALVVILMIANAKESAISVSGSGTLLIILALIFSLLLVVCEISMKILRPRYCAHLKETEKHAILTGLEVVETEMYSEEDN